MKISIITIVYNDKKGVLQTIESVASQNYSNTEYIVIDGNSNDGTVEVVSNKRDVIDIFISEPDKGIYDAMNKGISLANGDWLIFMNAGDLFYSKDSISTVFANNIEANNYDIIYGDTIGVYNNGMTEYIKPMSLNYFWKHIPICHQSTFIKTQLHKNRLYDLKYKVSSVYDFLYDIYSQGYKFNYMGLPISKYNMEGYSSHSLLWLWDYIRISLKYSSNNRLKVLFKIFTYSIMRIIAYLKK